MIIFISHIQQESQVAQVLKKWIESAFADRCEVLLGTDPENIPELCQYLEKNDEAFLEVKALIILCSPQSVQKAWISFEAGCAWMRKIFILPLCCAGMSPSDLSPPLSAFSSLDMTQKDFGQKIMLTLAQELGISRLPALQYRQMEEELKETQASSPLEGNPTEAGGERGLEQIHAQILQVLAEGYGYTSAVLAEHFAMEEAAILPLLARLAEGNYVYASHAGAGHIRYNLASRGKIYLKENSST